MNLIHVLALYAKGDQEADPEDTVIAGLQVTHDSGLTLAVAAGGAVSFTGSYLSMEQGGWAFNDSQGEPFAVISPEDVTLDVDAGDAQERIDSLQIRPANTQVDNQTRSFIDPITELGYQSDIDTAVHYHAVLEVKKGTPGSGAAPSPDSGYIKLAEVTVGASAGSISGSDIVDFQESDLWVSDPETTVVKRTIGFSGNGTAFPPGPKDGQEFFRTDLDKFYKYSEKSGAWIQI